MRTTLSKTLAIAALGIFASSAFAADRVNANNNKVSQHNSGARAEQTVRIGFMDGPLIGSATVNANNNTVIQSNSAPRAKQKVELGVYK